MKTIGHSAALDDVRIIYRENNWKKRKFRKTARITSHNEEQLMNKKDERKTCCVMRELNCQGRALCFSTKKSDVRKVI